MFREIYNKKIEGSKRRGFAHELIKIFLSRKLVRGFTLVETLVAVSILSLSVLGGFTAVQNGLKSSITAKNQITAFYLVQEAMEFIKNVRDENALNFVAGGTNSWLDGLVTVSAGSGSGPCDIGKTCTIDAPNVAIASCSGVNTTCPVLRMETQTGAGLWGYTPSWTATNFKRAVSFQTVPGTTDEITVIVWISWTQGATTKTFQVSQSLFNRLQ